MDFERTVSFLNKSEGRDKFCKAIQYASRFLMWATLNKNKEISQRFNGLYVSMRDARKLFRLLKSINEYQKISKLLTSIEEDEFSFYFSILSRLGFLGYWFFDNLQILSKISFIKLDSGRNGKIAALFWFFALLFALVLDVRNFILSCREQRRTEKYIMKCMEQELDIQKNRLLIIRQKKEKSFLNIIKSLGDMITASQGSEIAPRLLKINFNDGWMGFGGFLSAIITSYQLY